MGKVDIVLKSMTGKILPNLFHQCHLSKATEIIEGSSNAINFVTFLEVERYQLSVKLKH